MIRNTIGMMLVLACGAATAAARNVDLITLPSRNRVQLTIYNSEDLTLVKETRRITLKAGMNELQFSWANTLIDPSSVEFRPLTHAGEVEVLDTVFPGGEAHRLIWRIESAFEGAVEAEVSYFTSGLTWAMDYMAVVDPAEETMRFDGFVRVFNRSGETYENAEVRLIVGTINLVEKIADLARREGLAGPDQHARLRRRAGRMVMAKAELACGVGSSLAPKAAPKPIVKEGLSEYFMFTVPGVETIPSGWSKRMPAVEADDVKFDIVYRMRSHQYAVRPVRFFTWRNDVEHGLGSCPLPDGRVRLFRRNGREGLTFLGAQQACYAPIKAEIEINLGVDDLVVYKTRTMGVKRMNFAFAPRGRSERVVGWDERTEWIDTIRNYRKKPIRFELRRRWSGDVEFQSEHSVALADYQTVEAVFTIPARDKLEFPAAVVRHHGENAGKSCITLH